MDIETSKKIKEGIRELERSIGIQEGFFNSLLGSDSDWLFIIRLHALFEAVSTTLVIKALGKETLIDVISRANMSVKAQYIERLNLLNKDAVRLIRALSQLRNTYIHNIRNISLTLDEYLKERNEDQKKEFINTFGYDTVDEFVINGHTIKKKPFILGNPRWAIYLGAFSVLSEVVAQLELEKVKLEEKELRAREAELHKRASELLLAMATKFASGK